MSVNVEKYLETRKKFIDDELDRFLADKGEVVRHFVKGGKRLRGVLTLLVCEALGGKVKDGLDGAVAVELMHSVSLAFDDIVDMDRQRRDTPAAWMVHRFAAPIIMGNLAISHALTMLQKYGHSAVDTAIKAWREATKGVMFEVQDEKGFGEKVYKLVSELKTGSVFSAAASLGALLSGKDDWVDLAGRYGRNVGLAFQLADDIVEFSKSSKGGLESFIAYITREDMASLKDKALERMEEFVRDAIQLADKFPEPFKDLLKEYPELAVKRMLEEVQWKWKE